MKSPYVIGIKIIYLFPANYANTMTGGTVLGSWQSLVNQTNGKLYHIGGDGPSVGGYDPETIITYTCYSDNCPGVTSDYFKELQVTKF